MTLSGLIDQLTEIRDLYFNPEAGQEDPEVNIATQPSWPFANAVHPTIGATLDERASVVYIGEGRQLGYLPQEAKDSLGDWSDK